MRRWVLGASAGIALGAGLLVARWYTPARPSQGVTAVEATPPGPASRPGTTSPAPAGPPPSEAAPPSAASTTPLAEYPLDLGALRAALPDSLYWETGAPTGDPEVARRRAERARRLNELYGKVLSGTGSEEEIRTYFGERRREHEEAIRFASAALESAGDALPDRDRGLLELAMELHTKRLSELPRRQDDALARKAEQDRRREAWRGGQAR